MTEQPQDAPRPGEEKTAPEAGDKDSGRPAHVRTEGEMAVDDALGQGTLPEK